MTSTSSSEGVMAVVLTYNAPHALRRCIQAIDGQVHAPNAIHVADNASVEPATAALSNRRNGVPLAVERLVENLGPAGGYAAALRSFLASDHAWAWVMDDDCVPAPDSLRQLLTVAAAARDPVVVMSTMVDMETGTLTNTQGWCGVLIPRAAVAMVGVPNADLFWWTEDTEYLQWRMPRAGFSVVRSELARVTVPRKRRSREKPAWKYFYETRNQVHFRLYVQQPAPSETIPTHLRLRVRAYRALRATTKLLARAIFVEPHERFEKVRMVLRGARDGLRGHLGRRITASSADRPAATERANP